MDGTKILSGPATVLIGDVGGAYENIGYTRDGININKSRDTREIEADQSMYPLYVAITKEGYTIDMRLLESTYKNLGLAWDEPGTIAGLSGKLGMSSGSAPSYKKIKVYGKRKDSQLVTWEFLRCMPTAFGAYSFSKGGEGLIEVTFTALWDDTAECIGYFSPATEA